jgi:hypothetical protein
VILQAHHHNKEILYLKQILHLKKWVLVGLIAKFLIFSEGLLHQEDSQTILLKNSG